MTSATATERLRAKHANEVEVRQLDGLSLESWSSDNGSITTADPSHSSGLQKLLGKIGLGKRPKRTSSPCSIQENVPSERASFDIPRPPPLLDKRASWTPLSSVASSATLPTPDDTLPPLQPTLQTSLLLPPRPALLVSQPTLHKDLPVLPDVADSGQRPLSEASFQSTNGSLDSAFPPRAPSPSLNLRSRSRSPSLANPRHLFDRFMLAFSEETYSQSKPSVASRRIKSIKTTRQASPSPIGAPMMRSGKFSQPNPTIDLLPGPGARMGTYQSVFGHARRSLPKSQELECIRQDDEQILVFGAMEATVSRRVPPSPRREKVSPAATPVMDPLMLAPQGLPTRRPSQHAPTQYSLSLAAGSNFFDDTLNAMIAPSPGQPEKRFEEMVRQLATDTTLDISDDESKAIS